MKCEICGTEFPNIYEGNDSGLILTGWRCGDCHHWNDIGKNELTFKKVFTKYDSGKLRYGLIPPIAEREMVGVLTFGAKKYSVDNWRNCDDLSRYVDAALRHISAYRTGQQKDEETGLHHLAHAVCCLNFIVDIEMGAPTHRDDSVDSAEVNPCDGCAYQNVTHKGCVDCIEGSEFKEVQS